jgi:hypothetical protein
VGFEHRYEQRADLTCTRDELRVGELREVGTLGADFRRELFLVFDRLVGLATHDVRHGFRQLCLVLGAVVPWFVFVRRHVGCVVEVRGIDCFRRCTRHAHAHEARLGERVVEVATEQPEGFGRRSVFVGIEDTERDESVATSEHDTLLPAQRPTERADRIGKNVGCVTARVVREFRRRRAVDDPLFTQHVSPNGLRDSGRQCSRL